MQSQLQQQSVDRMCKKDWGGSVGSQKHCQDLQMGLWQMEDFSHENIASNARGNMTMVQLTGVPESRGEHKFSHWKIGKTAIHHKQNALATNLGCNGHFQVVCCFVTSHN